MERALEICGLPPGSRVADIGCGPGGTLEHLERTGIYRSVGLDYSGTLLAEAVPRLASGRLVRGRAETLPLKTGCFDALFCECVLSILKDRIAALGEFARVLKEGGFLIVSDVFGHGGPGQERLEEKLQGFRTKGLLVKEGLLDLLARLGFSLLLWEEHGRLLKEFAARMILAGVCLPDAWGFKQGQKGKKTNRPQISYFLLVALKAGTVFQSVGNEGDGKSWTT